MINLCASRSSHSSRENSEANIYQESAKKSCCEGEREREREREKRRKEKKADDSSRKSRGTAAADLCGAENPGKLLSRHSI